MKLFIHGPYPPPIGGISIHIYRIEKHLQKLGINYTILNHGEYKNSNVVALNKSVLWYIKELLKKKDDSLYHFHQFMFFHYPFYFLKSLFNPNLIITIHSNRIMTYGILKRWVAMFFLKLTRRKALLSVSRDLSDYLNAKSVTCRFLPAYVPPDGVAAVKLPRREHKRYFMFSMWKVNKSLSEDVYNLPMALKFLNYLKEDYELLFLVGNETNSDTDYITKLIKSYDLNECITVLYNKEIVNYISNCDFLLRCNKHDGYGVSLQESMDMGVPVLATSVCERPKGTILFESENYDSLVRAYNYLKSSNLNDVLSKKEDLQYHTELLSLYKSIINK